MIATTQAELDAVTAKLKWMRQRVTLTDNGIRLPGPGIQTITPCEGIDACREFIREQCCVSKRLYSTSSSYGWKHICEDHRGLGGYVSNGEFIAAALLEGVPLRMVEAANGGPSLNVLLRLRPKGAVK